MARLGPTVDITATLQDTALVEAALQRAVTEALRQHKRFGNPIAIWRDGQVVVKRLDALGSHSDASDDGRAVANRARADA
jgi:hypothetical protein